MSSSQHLPWIDNENDYFLFRQKLFAQPTVKQTQVAISAVAVNIVEKNQNSGREITIKRNSDEFQNNLFIHCTYEKRLKGLAREIHTIHDSFFKNTDYGQIQLVVGHRNNPNMVLQLSRKRPLSSMLQYSSRKSRAHLVSLEFENSC